MLDEPTTSVDDASAQVIKEAVLLAHRQWGTSLVIASHDDQWLEGICDSRLYLYQGKQLHSSDLTLIHGPWQKQLPDMLLRRLSDGQTFQAPAPGGFNPEATAAIESDRITLSRTPPLHKAGQHVMEGTVVRLTLDRHSGRIKGAALVGDMVINVMLSSGENPLPGTTGVAGLRHGRYQMAIENQLADKNRSNRLTT